MRLYHLFIALALLIAALVQTAVGSPIDKLAIERALDLNDRDYDLDLDLELGHDREKRGRLASLFSSSSASPSPSSDPGPRRPSKPTLHLALAMTGDPGPWCVQ
jgi:hypothetical protein